MKKEWYENWFDSKYYHILYSNRNDQEASDFLDRIINKLNIPVNSEIADLACGKGRHSIYLNNKGMKVTGYDLSINSINHAKEFENQSLKFMVHDMREEFNVDRFDWVMNLFTSFGYFNNIEDNLKVLIAIRKSLKSNGKIVLDYFNSSFVIKNLNQVEKKTVQGTLFKIKREINRNRIIKTIEFETENGVNKFQESVDLLNNFDFEWLFSMAKLSVVDKFGDYGLNKFDPHTSPRMIYVLEKK
jgi:SAM-dependent methyltransferase